MAHRYGHPVAVIRAADGTPAHFRWKGSEWPVSEVFDTWHLMNRWWERPTNPATAAYALHHGEQDRTYYRGCCRGSAGVQVYGLFHAVTNLWVLEVAHDGLAAAGADHVPRSRAKPSQAEPNQVKPSRFRVPVSISTAVNRITDHANAGRGRAAPVHAPASPTPST
jgi:Family of unknown function (DUF6504)